MAQSSPRRCPIQWAVWPCCRPRRASSRVAGEWMTIAELLALRLREARRLAEAAPFSPEWDAAMAAVEDLDEALRTRDSGVNDAATSRPPSTDTGASRDVL